MGITGDHIKVEAFDTSCQHGIIPPCGVEALGARAMKNQPNSVCPKK